MTNIGKALARLREDHRDAQAAVTRGAISVLEKLTPRQAILIPAVKAAGVFCLLRRAQKEPLKKAMGQLRQTKQLDQRRAAAYARLPGIESVRRSLL
jgi:hypothetical protein